MLKGRGIDGREAQGTFCHDRNILFLDWGGSCMSLCHLTFKNCAFYFMYNISQFFKKSIGGNRKCIIFL